MLGILLASNGCTKKASNSDFEAKGGGKIYDQLIVSITPIHLPIDLAKVRSIASYITLVQLGRSLVKRDSGMQVSGDLAESWEINSAQTKFTFQLSSGNRFSSGDPISAEDVVCSLQRQMKLNVAVHFDFSTISKISYIGNEITIDLKSPNPRFIQQMVHPEFGVLNKKNCLSDIDQLDFSITSGPYFMSKDKPSNGVILTRNPYFKDFTAPKTLKIVDSQGEEVKSMIQMGKLDFTLGAPEMSKEELLQLKKSNQVSIVQPHIGFSYWLSVNPLNKDMQVKKSRLSLLAKLKRHFDFNKNLEPYWSEASQLYMPGGTGRLSEFEVNKFWNSIQQRYKDDKIGYGPVKVLLYEGFPLKKEITAAFKKAGIRAQFDYYSNLKQFEEFIHASPNKYHMFQINNDFSAMDLFENLKVSFNSSRPLILLGEAARVITPLMQTAEKSSSESEMGDAYQQIERTILNEGLIFPIAYNHMLFYIRNGFSIESWSKFYPEVAFWKIQPSK